MAIELGAAYISILPSTSKLAGAIKGDLRSVEGEASSAGAKAGQGYASGFATKFASIAKVGLLAGLGGVSLLGGLGIKTAADMEQAQIAFETMLGSGKKAKDFIADLSDFAAKTPFDFPGLQESASSLISAGISADDVIPIMTTLGDVTSGMGTGADGIDRATTALQQMTAAGRITGEDLNQLRDAGIPVYDLLAAATGRSKAEVVKLSQAGKLGAEDLAKMMEALKSGKGLERFSGLMGKQAQSLTGMWSTFSDNLQMGLAKAVKPLIPLLKDGLGNAATAVVPILAKVASGIGAVILATKSVVNWAKEHSTTTTILATVIGSLVGGLMAYKTYITIVSAVTKAWAFAQGLLNAAMALNPVGLVIAGLAALAIGLTVAYKKSETFRGIVDGAFSAIKAVAGPVLSWLTGAVGTAIDFVRNNWKTMVAILGGPIGVAAGLIKTHFGAIKGAASDVVSIIRGIPGKIGELASKFAGAGRDLISSFVGGMKNAGGVVEGIAGNVWNAVKGLINKAIRKINDALNFSISLPGPDVNVSAGKIPYLAQGGIVTRPTLAVVGEAGPEAVVPLAGGNGRRAMSHLLPNGRGGDGAQVVQHVYPQPGQSEEEVARMSADQILWRLNK